MGLWSTLDKGVFKQLFSYLIHLWFPVFIDVQGIRESPEAVKYFEEAFCLRENRLLQLFVDSIFILTGKELVLNSIGVSLEVDFYQREPLLELGKELFTENELDICKQLFGIKENNSSYTLDKENSLYIYKFYKELSNCCNKKSYEIKEMLNKWIGQGRDKTYGWDGYEINREQITSFIDWYKELCSILGLVNDKVMS